MRGVLHRDISPGNILIKWRPGSEPDQPSMSGCVIDLDHAKKGNLAHDEVKAPIVDKTINRVHNAIVDVEVEREVARLLLEFYPVNRFSGQAIPYIEAALAHASSFRSFTEQPCTPQHLRWKSVWLHRSPFRCPGQSN